MHRAVGPASVALLALFCTVLQAQPVPRAGTLTAPQQGPLNPSAAVPPLPYVSVFAAPHPPAPPDPIGWKQANAVVGRIGGWRAYAREATDTDPSKPSALAGEALVPGTIPRHGAHPMPRLE